MREREGSVWANSHCVDVRAGYDRLLSIDSPLGVMSERQGGPRSTSEGGEPQPGSASRPRQRSSTPGSSGYVKREVFMKENLQLQEEKKTQADSPSKYS